MRTGFRGKRIDVTQGGLIVSANGGKVENKAVMDEFAPMDGKKSEQGIVVNKLTRKATKVSDHLFD